LVTAISRRVFSSDIPYLRLRMAAPEKVLHPFYPFHQC